MAKLRFLFGTMGSGKSTQYARIVEDCRAAGLTVCEVREPGGTAIGEQIRGLLLARESAGMAVVTELLLMFAARAQHLAERIEPALADGQIVLCDRFTDASYAYQGSARGLGHESVATLERLVQGEPAAISKYRHNAYEGMAKHMKVLGVFPRSSARSD